MLDLSASIGVQATQNVVALSLLVFAVFFFMILSANEWDRYCKGEMRTLGVRWAGEYGKWVSCKRKWQ